MRDREADLQDSTDAMILIVRKDWYAGLTGPASRWQVGRPREDTTETYCDPRSTDESKPVTVKQNAAAEAIRQTANGRTV